PGEACLEQDILLEAAVFAADATRLLQEAWPDLVANSGLLLNRLLGRFMHVATVENPAVIQALSVHGAGSSTFAATLYRLPILVYWLPMLRLICSHGSEVQAFARERAAEVAFTWLGLGY